MAGKLRDGGTLDVVVCCEYCGEESRYASFSQVEEDGGPPISFEEYVHDCLTDFEHET